MALTKNQGQEINNIDMVVSGISLIGMIGGIVYSHKTGGGFWRGLGYSILGSLIIGVPAELIALPFKNKILKEGDKTSSLPLPKI